MIKVDRHTVIQILGGLMARPDYLADTDKYCLEPSNFPNVLDRYIFACINNLYNCGDGANKIRSVDIEEALKVNATAYALFEKENGRVFLQDCETNGEPENFDYYYKKLKKINLIIDLNKMGYNTEQFYSENLLDINANENFEKLTTDDILNKVKLETANLENKYAFNNKISEGKPIDGILDLVLSMREAPEIGCRLQGDIYNTILRGGRKGKMYIRSGSSGMGKALPNYTKIPTPNGWTTVGEVKVGDYLFDRTGKPTRVLAIYPQEEKKQIYKVYFKSGRIAECCNEHLWSYYSNLNDKNPNKLITSTLQEIIDNPKGLKRNDGAYRWSIPVCEPVQYDEKKYSIDPYVMGLILGDGSFRYQNNKKDFSFSSCDEELVAHIQERMNYSSYKKNKANNYSWYFESNFEGHKNVWVEDILKQYPELWNKKSEDKFIPQEFLFGSIEQRFDLLAGLLDTDGSIDEKGRINFTTISPKLRDNIIELCESLGMTCSYLTDKRSDKYTTGECYNVHILAPSENKIKMFKLARKLDIAYNYLNNNKRKERRDRDSIVKIEPTEKFVDMTCFYVDNEEHLFLMNNYICTHNTRRMVGDACYIAYPVRYDNDRCQWVSTGSCEKVLYIMTEQDTEEINTMILSYLTGINEEKLIYGTYTDEELERYKIAIDIMKRYEDNFFYVRIPDPCASIVKNVCRRYNIQHGVENIFYDYIFSSPAMLNEYRDLKLPEFVCLRLFATAIKNLAVELNAFIMTSTQISNDDDKTGGFRDYHCIQGAKQIVNLADAAGIVSRPTKEELTQLGSILETIGVVPNCVHDIFKNRRGRWTCVRVWSYVDLGTLRTTDLFITTANMKPIEDFQIMDYKMEQDFSDVCEFYNGGACRVPVMATAEEVKEEPKPPKQIEMVDFTEVPLSDLRPEELVYAFNEREKIDIDLENAKLEDLI